MKMKNISARLSWVIETESIFTSLFTWQEISWATDAETVDNNNNNYYYYYNIQPAFISRKLNEDLKFREVKPAIFNQQCLVYQFQCNLCDAGYVGYTRGHLHERVDGYKQKSSSICKHYLSEHNSDVPAFLSEQFHVITKGSNKFDYLIKEMLFIRKLKPSLNVQADSIRAKVFTWRTCDPLLLC